jgi:hypothetical protein
VRSEVQMTTQARGKATDFLPFNGGNHHDTVSSSTRLKVHSRQGWELQLHQELCCSALAEGGDVVSRIRIGTWTSRLSRLGD